MASRRVQDNVAEQLNQWIRREAQGIAEKMGLDTIPMRDPNFNFYEAAAAQIKKLGFKGQDLDATTSDVVQNLFFNPRTGGHGAIYNYPKYHADNPYIPFDQYFTFAVSQKGKNALGKYMRVKKHENHSIVPGNEEGESGISESHLGKEETFELPMMAEERSRIWDEVKEMLASQTRGGESLVWIWELMRKGHGLREIADIMTNNGILTARGGFWSTGAVDVQKQRVLRLVRDFMEERGLGMSDLKASRGASRVFYGGLTV